MMWNQKKRDYEAICNAWSYLDNRIAMIERQLNLGSESRPTLRLPRKYNALWPERPTLTFGDTNVHKGHN